MGPLTVVCLNVSVIVNISVNLTKFSVTWEGNLNEELSRLSWPVGMPVRILLNMLINVKRPVIILGGLVVMDCIK